MISIPEELQSASQEVFETCYRGRQSRWHHMAWMRMSKVLFALRILDRCNVKPEGYSVFDYGFGAGTLFHYLPKSCKLAGVEQDPVTVGEVEALLRSKGYKDLDLQTIDIATWSSHPLFRESAYDLIVCSHVLEHLPDPVALLTRFRSCLKPGGHILALLPINEIAENPHHLWKCNRPLILEWAKAAGLQLTYYEENSPWSYWLQPLLVRNSYPSRLLWQAFSFGMGAFATALGHRWLYKTSRPFSVATRSKPTQAGFLLHI